MAAGQKNADIRLSGGPGDRMTFSREDWETRIMAAHRMSRRTVDGPGWALGYERPQGATSGAQTLSWRGVNCYPVDQIDPELLHPYGSFLHDTTPGNQLDGVRQPAA